MAHRTVLTIGALAMTLLSLAACASTTTTSPARSDRAEEAKARPTAAFHGHHADVREHLNSVDTMLAELRSVGPSTQRSHMTDIVTYLNRNLRPHISGEENSLYDLADEKAGSGGERYTASLRYEHQIMHRWIAEMEREAASPERDAREFARSGDRLIGLIRAHLETEEQVVLPMLDRTTTAAEFDRRVMAR